MCKNKLTCLYNYLQKYVHKHIAHIYFHVHKHIYSNICAHKFTYIRVYTFYISIIYAETCKDVQFGLQYQKPSSASSLCRYSIPRPAHCGAAKGQLETLRILGTHGANLWVRNVKGDYPLHEAVASGRKDLVRWLLTQRPDAVNSPNNDGRCPLHIAAINNNVEMCKVCEIQ